MLRHQSYWKNGLVNYHHTGQNVSRPYFDLVDNANFKSWPKGKSFVSLYTDFSKWGISFFHLKIIWIWKSSETISILKNHLKITWKVKSSESQKKPSEMNKATNQWRNHLKYIWKWNQISEQDRQNCFTGWALHSFQYYHKWPNVVYRVTIGIVKYLL